MPYILNKTNGTVITTVQDASLDQTTDLLFVGKNYSGYGEVQNENFLKLLENFANITSPPRKIEGQLWYDTVNKRLNVYDNINWKPIANIEVAIDDPSLTKSPTVGNLWYDTQSDQLSVWNGIEYILIGPPNGSDIRAQWRGDFEYDAIAPDLPVYNIKAIVGAENEVIAIVSAETYNLADYAEITESPLYKARSTTFTRITKGITLVGADPVTGSSRREVTGLSTSSYFWGTAAESLTSLYATTSTNASGITARTTATNAQFYVTFINSNTNAVYIDGGITYNPSTNILSTIASSALYADIAERYEADAIYDKGTVLVIGGEKEVTISTERASTTVAGIVSEKPAYMMNSEAGTDETHPYIALKGRVFCKIIGSCKKGDLLVTSGDMHGYATVYQIGDDSNAVIGKALEQFEGPFGVIEVKV